jgi:hypothetical protein
MGSTPRIGGKRSENRALVKTASERQTEGSRRPREARARGQKQSALGSPPGDLLQNEGPTGGLRNNKKKKEGRLPLWAVGRCSPRAEHVLGEATADRYSAARFSTPRR